LEKPEGFVERPPRPQNRDNRGRDNRGRDNRNKK
jgi:polyribonucleotide nucleotidyltransferase